jgi:hypothetical protein
MGRAVVGRRYSDAALFTYQSENLADFGLIARTIRLGSKTISTSSPRFMISEVSLQYPLVGTTVNKMGFKTGWTSGDIEYGKLVWPHVGNTCVDFFGTDGIVRLCQVGADYSSDHGDSGAPVFTWDGYGSDVVLVGIHVGADYSHYFSPWLYVSWEVEGELGPWQMEY